MSGFNNVNISMEQPLFLKCIIATKLNCMINEGVNVAFSHFVPWKGNNENGNDLTKNILHNYLSEENGGEMIREPLRMMTD